MHGQGVYSIVVWRTAVKIPINAPFIGREEISAVNSVLKSGALTSAAMSGGRNVQELEGTVRSFVKSRYAVAVNSGTAALQAALYSLGIKSGDEVIVPSFSFVASANAIASTGARPVFADILQENLTVDPKSVQKNITKKTKAIMPVHLYGHAALLDEIGEIAKKNNLAIVEDAAQSLGTTLRKRHTGTFLSLDATASIRERSLHLAKAGLSLQTTRNCTTSC